MGAEEERDAAAVRAVWLEPAEQIPRRRADDRPRLVLVDLKGEVAQVAPHGVGDRPFLAGRARKRGQLLEQVENGLIHFTNLLELGTISVEICRRRMSERRRTLRASGLLGEAIDRAPDAVLVADESMRYLAVNQAGAGCSATRVRSCWPSA